MNSKEKPTFSIIAYRGASKDAPENTLSAFRQAFAMGVDYILCDVQISRDGIPLLIHDATLDRTTDAQSGHAVDMLDASMIKTLDAGSWFDEKYHNEKVCTLEELLYEVPQEIGVVLNVQKETFHEGLLSEAIAHVLGAFAEKRTHTPPILLASSDVDILISLEKIGSYPTVAVVKYRADIKEFSQCRAQLYSLNDSCTDTSLIQQLQERGKTIWVWTVDDPKRAEHFIKAGVDGIVSSDPKQLLGLRER